MKQINTTISQKSITLLVWDDVIALCKISRAEIYRRIKKKTFPAPIKLSPRKNVWPEFVIEKWLQDVVKNAKL